MRWVTGRSSKISDLVVKDPPVPIDQPSIFVAAGFFSAYMAGICKQLDLPVEHHLDGILVSQQMIDLYRAWEDNRQYADMDAMEFIGRALGRI